ncbi:MAG: hypothetical protein K6A74_11600 [Lachnospiraceae bacterium]|nr:hypothetical protein [Lachnospiraceae bacterium]
MIKKQSIVKRILITITAAATVIAGVGCGKGAPASAVSEAPVQASMAVESPEGGEVSTEAEGAPAAALIDDNGNPINDFDEFVNGEWRDEQKAAGATRVYIHDEHQKVVDERLMDMLEKTDISGLSTDDGLYKAITLYREAIGDEDKDARIGAIKEYISKIEKVKGLNDLYKLYCDERYAISNPIIRFRFGGDDYGYIGIFFEPQSLTNVIGEVNKELNGDLAEGETDEMLQYMEALGYSEARIKEIADNSAKVAELVDAYWQNPENNDGYKFYRPAGFENAGVEVPFFDMIGSMGYLPTDDSFMAYPGIYTLLNELYKPENVPAIRDHLILQSAYLFFWVSGYGAEDPGMDNVMLSFAKSVCGDVLAAEYQKRYISDDVIADVTTLIADIKKCAIDTVCEAEWFTTHGKELARRKILRMTENLGENGAKYDFSGITLTEDPIEDYITVLMDRERFRKSQMFFEDEARQTFCGDVFVVNAKQYPELNEITLFLGMLSLYADLGDMPYEAKLGFIGNVIAHEVSHSYDPKTIDYESTGYFEPWLTDEEQEAYSQQVTALTGFLDTTTDEYGNVISGDKFVCETFTDILAMQICLRMLSEKENVDYDLFFRTYASQNALYYTEAAAETVLQDPHLPGKLRINYVVGQFDEFYATYDIDTNSPYYVPTEKRIKLF